MSQKSDSSKYAVLAQLRTDVQNPQELVAMWGDIKSECQEVGVTVEHSFASLGEFDFLLIIDAPSLNHVLKTSLILTRYGLTAQTLDIVPTDQFADIVQDM